MLIHLYCSTKDRVCKVFFHLGNRKTDLIIRSVFIMSLLYCITRYIPSEFNIFKTTELKNVIPLRHQLLHGTYSVFGMATREELSRIVFFVKIQDRLA